jgi:Putative prokaryotic signal transducing protein
VGSTLPPSIEGNERGEDDGAGGELVGVAFAHDLAEAAMIQGLLEASGITSMQQSVGVNGPLLGFGWLNPGGGSRRIVVRAEQARQAMSVLAGVVARGEEEVLPDIANSEHLADARGHKPRNYGLFGRYVRIYLWSLGALAAAFLIFLLLR